jgi:lipoprotein-anchoring transpeptidase ErfK/SrfK
MSSHSRRSSRTGALRRSWSASRRMISGPLTLLCACAALSTTASSADASSVTQARSATHGRGSQQLAVLDFEHRVYQFPRTNSQVKASIPPTTPITGEPTTLPVIAQTTNRSGRTWLEVMLPGRPNSSTGWIMRGGTEQQSTGWSIKINTTARFVWVYNYGKLARSFSAVVGKSSTPTPTGQFFVEESVIMPTSEPGGPYALALSARSDVFQQFDGGPGQIAIHGLDGLGGTPGQAESHGCVRLATPDITWLAARIVPGTRVTIS